MTLLLCSKLFLYSKSQSHYNSLQSPTKFCSFPRLCTWQLPSLHAFLYSQTYSHFLHWLFIVPEIPLCQMSALLSPWGRLSWLPNILCFKKVFATPLGCMTDLPNEMNGDICLSKVEALRAIVWSIFNGKVKRKGMLPCSQNFHLLFILLKNGFNTVSASAGGRVMNM